MRVVTLENSKNGGSRLVSYHITVGRSPDYVMRRGHEILNYSCHIHLGNKNEGMETIKILSNRSLLIIAREVSQIASAHLGLGYHLRGPSNKTDRLEIQLNAADRSKTILVNLGFSVGLAAESQGGIGIKLYDFILKFRDT